MLPDSKKFDRSHILNSEEMIASRGRLSIPVARQDSRWRHGESARFAVDDVMRELERKIHLLNIRSFGGKPKISVRVTARWRTEGTEALVAAYRGKPTKAGEIGQ